MLNIYMFTLNNYTQIKLVGSMQYDMQYEMQ